MGRCGWAALFESGETSRIRLPVSSSKRYLTPRCPPSAGRPAAGARERQPRPRPLRPFFKRLRRFLSLAPLASEGSGSRGAEGRQQARQARRPRTVGARAAGRQERHEAQSSAVQPLDPRAPPAAAAVAPTLPEDERVAGLHHQPAGRQLPGGGHRGLQPLLRLGLHPRKHGRQDYGCGGCDINGEGTQWDVH
ncbi:hypothetical protein NDU88_000184 [Pleurodeles waltl]|uniref:Uncharacterized protein n=1 Tax=Pleurodeles waltl TaxID=8319 RepID=A0AAV7KMB1_PLEWA|nr:hypothetical protein NDU88_000184 [Pleurodeles waltl]